jgi:hypothetical protein
LIALIANEWLFCGFRDCTADGLDAEVQAHKKEDRDYSSFDPQTEDAPGTRNLSRRQAPAQPTILGCRNEICGNNAHRKLPTCERHLFSDHRTALHIAFLNWLNALNP